MGNNLDFIQMTLSKNSDLEIRKIQTDLGNIYVIFINTICDHNMISQSILKPLIEKKDKLKNLEVIKNQISISSMIENILSIEDAITKILSGNTLILFDFNDEMLSCSTKKIASRQVEVPPTEAVIKGPREGFTENLNENLSLLRKRITNNNLKCEMILLGKENITEVNLIYIEGYAPKKLVNHVRNILKSINIKFIQYSHYIIEQLQDKPSAFDTVGYTEKPDVFCAKISEGRVGVLIEGDPFGITVPHFFIENFQSPNDYNTNRYTANYIRIIRWAGFGIALLLPSIFIALTTHHFSLIPPLLLFRLAVARAGIPFPVFLEILLMMFFFQLLREAGVRLPQSIGQAISIVGALILGDTAVKSGLSSTVAVLLVALTSLSAFLVPNIFGSIAIWTDILIILSALVGLPGFFIGFLIFLSHIAGLTSCGYPYLYPMGTMNTLKKKDHILRSDLNKLSNLYLDKDDE